MADDDLFASLGGTLMRDILADLQVDDDGSNWLSLEQLEQELSKLDAPNPDFLTHAMPHEHPPLSAASMVVQSASTAAPPAPPPQPPAPIPDHSNSPPPPLPADSWSLSMQRFAQSSLEQDFLQADSARKAQSQQAGAVKAPPGLDWSTAEEYDTSSALTSLPPPGLGAAAARTTAPHEEKSPQQLLTEAADRLRKQLQMGGVSDSRSPSEAATAPTSRPMPPPVPARPPPMTPQNSISMIFPPPTPPPSATATPAQARAVVSQSSSLSMSLPTMPENGPVPSGSMQPPPQQPPVVGMGMGTHTSSMPPSQVPPTGIPMGLPAVGVQVPFPPHHGGGPASVPAIPIANRPPAWQIPPPGHHPHPPPMMQPLMPTPPPPPPPVRMYCNPHPRAPPIPAAAIASNHMSARDISYVVHSMMKPLLSAGVSPYDYDVQYFLRRSGAAAVAPVGDGGPGKEKGDVWVGQIESRHAKSKEWSASQKVLGHVAKSNVARPRALISTSAASLAPDDDSGGSNPGEQRQRASLWRSRIYCDQAYQAYFAVLANWRGEKSASSMEVQTQYRRLFKCLGIAPAAATEDGKENAYQVADKTPLQRLLKLEKGRVLVARILEQAVLPPSAMQTLLPSLLEALLSTTPTPPSAKGSASQQAVDDRLFLALTRVIQTLPTLDTLLDCMKAASQPAALASTLRMQCVHAVLQRGAAEKPRMGPSEQEQWNVAEADFLNFLSGS